MIRPSVKTRCVADQHCDRTRERIIEFNDGPSKTGGLISFRRQPDGRLMVMLYELDANVLVRVSPVRRRARRGS